MENLKKELTRIGWHLSDEGLAICQEELEHDQQLPSSKEITKCALNLDLTEIGSKVLPEDLNKGKVKEFNGPCVLQVVKTRNAAAPKANEKSSVAPRMLQVHLTDGHKTCVALEHGNFQNKLSLETPPGSKICINGSVEVRSGFLLLNCDQVSLLGGRVESIYNKWIVTKDAGGFSRAMTDVDEAPPPFVQFGNKISSKYNTNKPSLQKSSAKQGKDDEDNKEFAEQRHAAIAEIKKNMTDTAGKTFANGKTRTVEKSTPSTLKKEVFKYNGRNPAEPQQINQGRYRQPGAFKVDENSCDKIVQMGFPRESANDALCQFNNNLERALEHLLGTGGSQATNDDRSRVLRPARNESFRDKRNDRRGRGRGPSNRSRGDNDDDAQRQSSKSTLFDFLETKMTPAPKNEPNAIPSTSRQCSSVNSVMDGDEAIQEESILAYVKQLSLVETRGGSPDRQVRRSEDPPTRSEKSENSGVAKYRGQANHDKISDESYDDRRRYNKDQSNPNRSRYKDRRNKFSQDRQDTREDYYNSNDRYERSFNSERDRGGRKERKSFTNDRERNHEDEYHDNFDKREKRDNRRRPPRDADGNDPVQPHDSYNSNRNDRGKRYPKRSDNRKPRYDNHSELPPRFQKKQMQEASQAYRAPRPSADSCSDQNDKANAIPHNKGLTLADTARQLGTETNSYVQHPPDPVHPESLESHMMVTRQSHASASHSYQDQRQQVRSQSSDNSYSPSHSNRDHQDFVWTPGMMCKAKYWEDNQFYDARVDDVHRTEPTAVVTFMEYGNSEEVLFADMRPMRPEMSGPPRDNGSYAGPVGGLEFTRGHKGPTRYPNQDERRRNMRPAQSLYQPPSKK